MAKSFILLLYGVALFFVIRNYYSQGNSGIPSPQVVRNPSYLYGILALSADFIPGLPIALAAALTVALIWQINGQSKTTSKSTPSKSTPNQEANVG